MSVHQLAPLPVVIPLLTAAAIVISSAAPRRVHDAMATAAAAATGVLCAVLLAHAKHRPIVEWLGGWHPHHAVALGIALAPDQLGAGLALLASVVLVASTVYGWFYFEELDGFVHALMLVLGAAIVGLCLSGDLFTMIVFFVLMTVTATGLTAVENEHAGPLQGAINFAVLNGIAGFAALLGAALVYGRTGALNLAQIATKLDHHPADALVAVGFALLALAFLTKAAAVPFHFWMPDVHAVAPTPVCALFSGVMGTTAVFGVARILSTAFAQPLQDHVTGVRTILVVLGAATAVIGGLSAFQQRHIKRVIAFATVSQIGVMIAGVGLLRDRALAGAALTAVGAGLTLAALFAANGVLLRRHASTDEFELRGKGRDLFVPAGVFTVGGLLLAGLPPGAGFFGRALIDAGSGPAGQRWLPFALVISSALTGGAVLRVAGRVFAGWGTARDEETGLDATEQQSQQQSSEEEEEDDQRDPHPSPLLSLVSLVLLVGAVAVCILPGFVRSVVSAAAHFRDVGAYLGVVLLGAAPHYKPVPAFSAGTPPLVFSAASVVLALVIAWAGLRGRSVAPGRVVHALHAAHSGHVGDYVAWWTFGVAVIGGLVLWAVAG